jgi:hypothetical protein
VSAEGGCAFHPNLFGVGDPGVVVLCQRGVIAWRKNTNTWHQIPGLYTGTVVGDVPTCVYITGLGAVIVSNGDSFDTWSITSGPTVTQLQDAPFKCGAVSWDSTSPADAHGGIIVDDPQQRATCYILEKTHSTATQTRQVYKYSAGTWVLQSYGHPFVSPQSSGEDWAAITLYGYGTILGLERINNTFRARIWRPNT